MGDGRERFRCRNSIRKQPSQTCEKARLCGKHDDTDIFLWTFWTNRVNPYRHNFLLMYFIGTDVPVGNFHHPPCVGSTCMTHVGPVPIAGSHFGSYSPPHGDSQPWRSVSHLWVAASLRLRRQMASFKKKKNEESEAEAESEMKQIGFPWISCNCRNCSFKVNHQLSGADSICSRWLPQVGGATETEMNDKKCLSSGRLEFLFF